MRLKTYLINIVENNYSEFICKSVFYECPIITNTTVEKNLFVFQIFGS